MNSPSSASDQAPTPPCAFPADSARWFREELQPHDAAVRGYLISAVRSLLAVRAFDESLPGQLPPDQASQQRLPLLRRKFTAIAALS